jgi:predicted TIM-barrel fold metal-dependent hydrolase
MSTMRRCHRVVFSPDRCMFGSNWPVDSLYGSLTDYIRALGSIIAEFGRDAAEPVFRLTAERSYRI